MAVAWTDITNAQVAAGAAVTTALMTALRDNPEGIAQRASGAPKIFGNAYDYQEFTSSGSWNKPSNAETGDVVVVQVVGGGGAGNQGGTSAGGGGGGGGAMQRFDEIDDLPASVSLTVGAGGATAGANGGNSTFAATAEFAYLIGYGGTGGPSAAGTTTGDGDGGRVERACNGVQKTTTNSGGANTYIQKTGQQGGDPGNLGQSGQASITGGGGGGTTGTNTTNDYAGGPSMYAGGGGLGGGNGAGPAALRDGMFPGGGGGGHDTTYTGTFGDGGDGVVRVWCIREEA